jgi:hypothetical protein
MLRVTITLDAQNVSLVPLNYVQLPCNNHMAPVEFTNLTFSISSCSMLDKVVIEIQSTITHKKTPEIYFYFYPYPC